MKILIFISQLNKGGAERVVCNLSNYLSNNNDVTIAVLRNRKIEYNFSDNIKIVNLETKKISKSNKIIKLFIRLKSYKKLIKNNKYDVILSFLPEPSFISLLYKKKSMAKIIISVRNDPRIEYRSFFRKILVKKLYKKADGFVFQTKEARDYFNDNIKQKSTIIMNSVDMSFFKEPYDGERNKEIVTVGRLNKQKNQEMLIKAFINNSKKYPDYSLIIYGEGELRSKLQNIIDSNDLSNRIKLPGLCDNIQQAIYKSSIFVLPSNYEGMPNALIEAMALGLPCISTDCPCGGPRELIKNRYNGSLIPVNNVEKLSDEIDWLLSNSNVLKKYSKNTRNILDKINPEKVNKEWEKYIVEITSK